MALNMFSIEETKLRSGSSSATTPTTYRSVAQVTIITILLGLCGSWLFKPPIFYYLGGHVGTFSEHCEISLSPVR